MLAVLLMASTSTTSLAQSRYRYSEREVRGIGFRNGLQFGIREGRSDRRMGKKFDFKRTRAYRDGKWGYRDDYRHDGNYKDGFREGFAAGYREGYDGFGRFDRLDDDRRDRYDRRDDWRDRRDY
jgi:hypothetical protein